MRIRRRLKALVKAVCFAVAALPVLPGAVHARDLEEFMDEPFAALSDEALSEHRGGFIEIDGWLLRFTAEKIHKVNGEVAWHHRAVLDQMPGIAQSVLKSAGKPAPVLPSPATKAVPETVVASALPATPEETAAQVGSAIVSSIPVVTTSKSPQTTSAPDGAPDALAMFQSILNNPVVVVNTHNNVRVEDVTRITVDVANFASLAALAGQAQVAVQSLDLIRAQLIAGMGGL